MLYFAVFTIGYFVGVVTVLAVFPPQVKEIQEQEKDALTPIIRTELEAKLTPEQEIGQQVALE